MRAFGVSRFPYIKDIYFEDEKGASWTLKELEKLTEELAHEPDDITVYSLSASYKAAYSASLFV
jgi:ribonuclease HI